MTMKARASFIIFLATLTRCTGNASGSWPYRGPTYDLLKRITPRTLPLP